MKLIYRVAYADIGRGNYHMCERFDADKLDYVFLEDANPTDALNKAAREYGDNKLYTLVPVLED